MQEKEFYITLINGRQIGSKVEKIYDLIEKIKQAVKYEAGFILINYTLINIRHITHITFRPHEARNHLDQK